MMFVVFGNGWVAIPITRQLMFSVIRLCAIILLRSFINIVLVQLLHVERERINILCNVSGDVGLSYRWFWHIYFRYINRHYVHIHDVLHQIQPTASEYIYTHIHICIGFVCLSGTKTPQSCLVWIQRGIADAIAAVVRTVTGSEFERASICAIARRGRASTHLCQSISVVRRLSLIWVIAFHNKKKNAIHNLLNWNNGGGRGVDLCVFIVLMVE